MSATRCGIRPATTIFFTVGSAVASVLLACSSALDAGRPPVAAVTVSPPSLHLTLGSVAPLQAVAKTAAGDVIHDRNLFWTSSDTTVATVSAAGIVTALALGTAVIAASAEGESGTATVTVAPPPVARVAVLPDSAQTTVGATVQLQAVTYDDAGHVLTGRVVAWSSSNEQIATVDSTGRVRAMAAGSATISATSEGQTGTAVLVVLVPVDHVTVRPSSAIVARGGSTQLSALVYDAGGNQLTGRQITWASSDQSVATVTPSGLVTGVGIGSAHISATVEGKSGSAYVLVSTLLVNLRGSAR